MEQADRSPLAIANYERQRDVLIDAMTHAINTYITSQEASVGGDPSKFPSSFGSGSRNHPAIADDGSGLGSWQYSPRTPV